jgi:hypothetical protein
VCVDFRAVSAHSLIVHDCFSPPPKWIANDKWNFDVSGQGLCYSDNLTAVDLWETDRPAALSASSTALRSCSQANQLPICAYGDLLLTDRSVQIVERHNLSFPMFLYHAVHAMHGPLQVPTSQ